jgi:glycosyltransferase involved in cell wall biosynthesis
MMRFVFVSLGYHPDQIGGAYRYTTEVAVRLADRGSKVQVLYPSKASNVVEREKRDGVELIRIPDESSWFYKNWVRENRSMRLALKSSLSSEAPGDPKPLVCLCHAFFAPSMNWISKSGAIPRAYIYHGPWSEEFLYAKGGSSNSLIKRVFIGCVASQLRSVELKALNRSRSIALMSHSMLNRLQKVHGSSMVKPDVIYGGVNEDQFKPAEDRPGLRAKYGLATDDFLLLAVRRLDPRMGLDCLIRALAKVRNEYGQVKLWIAGKGEQQEHLKALAKDLGLEDSFKLLGFVPESELPDLYSVADCVIMPSLDLEGFGLATVEALSCGAPVIGSDSGATPELLQPLAAETQCNLVFKSGSEDSLAELLLEILRKINLLPERKTCREYVLKCYTWSGPVLAHEKIYQSATLNL